MHSTRELGTDRDILHARSLQGLVGRVEDQEQDGRLRGAADCCCGRPRVGRRETGGARLDGSLLPVFGQGVHGGYACDFARESRRTTFQLPGPFSDTRSIFLQDSLSWVMAFLLLQSDYEQELPDDGGMKLGFWAALKSKTRGDLVERYDKDGKFYVKVRVFVPECAISILYAVDRVPTGNFFTVTTCALASRAALTIPWDRLHRQQA